MGERVEERNDEAVKGTDCIPLHVATKDIYSKSNCINSSTCIRT